MKGLSRGLVPHQSALSLVGDAHGGEVGRFEPSYLHGLLDASGNVFLRREVGGSSGAQKPTVCVVDVSEKSSAAQLCHFFQVISIDRDMLGA